MGTVVQAEAIPIVGIELRTTNEIAFKDIPAHWQRFQEEAIFDHIPNKASDNIYGVYTNFAQTLWGGFGGTALLLASGLNFLSRKRDAIYTLYKTDQLHTERLQDYNHFPIILKFVGNKTSVARQIGM